MDLRLLTLTLFYYLLPAVKCVCYFPPGLQGQFEMQSNLADGLQVQYSPVNITTEAIPIWGQCHRKIGNNVILLDESGGAPCIRCFNLNLRSKNVLQVVTEGLNKCYTSEESAELSCPQGSQNLLGPNSKYKEVLLYKMREINGELTKPEYCPINGRFKFTYNINDGTDDKVECPHPTSEADNCPAGSTFNLHFKGCSFEEHQIAFDCLGHWDGPGNQKYLSLLDTRSQGPAVPRYRCALYQDDPRTGVINIAFSSDSTCSSGLKSATEGYEVVTLQKTLPSTWPLEVRTSTCRFPTWAQGVWEHLHVEGNGLTYRDHSTFKTYRLRCIGTDAGVREKIPVFVKSHCGEEKEFNCLWLKKRSNNVLEFQLSLKATSYSSDSLCDDENFDSQVWITQGRLDRMEESPCPVSGLYTGHIPDETSLCAKLSSQCEKPETMHYAVQDCVTMQPYEEREYRCLGQWKEGGFVYTYTQRTDAAAHECFVGSIASEDEIFITEAGEHCDRKVNPLHFGMKLNRQGTCTSSDTVPSRPIPPPFRPPVQPAIPSRPSRPSSTVPPWKTITDKPMVPVDSNDLSSAHLVSSSTLLLSITSALTFCLRLVS